MHRWKSFGDEVKFWDHTDTIPHIQAQIIKYGNNRHQKFDN